MNALPLVCLCVLSRTATPSAEVIKVEQDSDAMLPCSLGNKQNMESGLFHWKKAAQRGQQQKEVFFYEAASHYNNGLHGQSDEFRGRVAYFQDELKHGNASIVIRNTKMADGGNYTCAFPRLQTPQTFYVELVVGAAPKPSVTSLDQTETWSLLQCEAHGNPAPAVRWEDGSGRLLSAQEAKSSPRGSSFSVKVTVTVNQTDRYRCVATQEAINHRVHADIFVRMSPGSSGWTSSTVAALVAVAVVVTLSLVVVVLAVLVCSGYISLRRKSDSSGNKEETKETDSLKSNI